MCRDGIRKPKAQLELNLARDAKNSKNGFYRYIGQNRKTKESVHHHPRSPINEIELVTTNMEMELLRYSTTGFA